MARLLFLLIVATFVVAGCGASNDGALTSTAVEDVARYIHKHKGEVFDLRGRDLRGADLKEASLAFADLTGANLTGADLEEASLTFANLTGANLTGANLTDADLKGVIGLDGSPPA